jgi:hypothetical protein
MGVSSIKQKVSENIGVVVGMVAVLIMAGMTVAASISTQLQASVITAASFLEIYFLLWIVKQF